MVSYMKNHRGIGKKGLNIHAIIMLMLTLLASLTCTLKVAYTETKPRFSVIDADTGQSGVSGRIGDTFVLNVTLVNADNVYGWQVIFVYNSTVLNCTNVWIPSDNIFAANTSGTISPPPEINNTYGFFSYGCSLMGDIRGISVEHGILFQVEFQVIEKGYSVLRVATIENPAQIPGAYPGTEDHSFLMANDPSWPNLQYIEDLIADDATFAIEVPAPPYAYFEASAYTAYVNEEIIFNASKSNDPDGEIVSYQWNFGDGTTGAGAVITHTYSTMGTFAVTLTVTDNDGLNSTKTINITIIERPPPDVMPYIYAVIIAIIVIVVIALVLRKIRKPSKQ